MRVNLVVVGDPSWQLTHDCVGIWSRTDTDIVALDRANEGFSHSVALWTSRGVVLGFEPDVAGEAAGVAGDVAAAVIRKPFDRDGQARPNRYSTAATIRSRTSSPAMPPVVARKLMASRSQQSSANATRIRSPLSQPISKPSEHQRRLRSSTAMRPSWRHSSPAGVAIEQQAVNLHGPVDSLVIRRFYRGRPAPTTLNRRDDLNAIDRMAIDRIVCLTLAK